MEDAPTSVVFEAGSPGLAERVSDAVNGEGYAIVTGCLDADQLHSVLLPERVEDAHSVRTTAHTRHDRRG